MLLFSAAALGAHCAIGKDGTASRCVIKQLEPRVCQHSLTSLFWFLMVLQDRVTWSAGYAQWSSAKNQAALGCHHLAITLCGLSFLRNVLYFISLLTLISVCPSRGCFHPSQFYHTSNRSRHDMTPLSLLLDSHCLRDPEYQATCVA